jgi:hypothetical protein
VSSGNLSFRAANKWKISGQHLPESLQQRNSGRFPVNNQDLGCCTAFCNSGATAATGN